jgi:hypothetical protein
MDSENIFNNILDTIGFDTIAWHNKITNQGVLCGKMTLKVLPAWNNN